MANTRIRSRMHPLMTRSALLALTAVLAACGVTQPHRAPVEDRAPAAPAPAPVVEAKPAAPAPDAPRGVSHTVRPGDTLLRIALDNGLSWRDLARWNGLDNPNLIEVGQVLRLQAPAGSETRPVLTARPGELKPLDAKASAPAASAAAATAAASAVPAPAPSPVATAPGSAPAAAAAADGDVNWAWPAQGNLVAGFDEQRNKGLAIGGRAGDPVLAAADGRVMYAGSGLRGYGNMVIIKHNDTFLSAYAHNQSLLVKEDQIVKRGQPIAEMGSSDADQVKLHFEIRRRGKPVDPARLLPAR